MFLRSNWNPWTPFWQRLRRLFGCKKWLGSEDLGIRNSQLLDAYCRCDPRVPVPLGEIVSVFPWISWWFHHGENQPMIGFRMLDGDMLRWSKCSTMHLKVQPIHWGLDKNGGLVWVVKWTFPYLTSWRIFGSKAIVWIEELKDLKEQRLLASYRRITPPDGRLMYVFPSYSSCAQWVKDVYLYNYVYIYLYIQVIKNYLWPLTLSLW